MSFSLFSKNKKGTTNHLVVDIGSGSIAGALLVLNEENKTFALTKVLRKELLLKESAQFEEFVSSMGSGLKGILSSLTLNSGKIDGVHIFLSSPWYASQSRDIKIEKNSPFVVTKKMVVDMLSKEVSLFESSFSKKYTGIGSGISILEKKIINTKLNGYRTDDMVGKKVKLFEMSLFLSMSPKDIVEMIKDVSKKYCQKSKIYFHSSSFSIFMTLKSLLPRNETYLICDVGAELTEVTCVMDGNIVQSSSFPMGSETFIKEIMKKSNKNRLEALSFVRMYGEKTLSQEEISKFESSVGGVKDSWIKSFSKALDTISSVGFVPKDVYLFSKSDTKIFFDELIIKEPFFGAQGARSFSVTIVDAKYLSESVKVSSSESRDTSLMVSAFYMVKYLEHHQPEYAENY